MTIRDLGSFGELIAAVANVAMPAAVESAN